MTIKQFISCAIEGGWNESYTLKNFGIMGDVLLVDGMRSKALIVAEIILDPSAWRAVGKVKGWKEGEVRVCVGCGVSPEPEEVSLWGKHIGKYDGRKKNGCDSDVWVYNHGQYEIEMHGMIDALCDGKTIEEYIATI